jgi:hypothetical protein
MDTDIIDVAEKKGERNKLFYITVEYRVAILAKTEKEAKESALQVDDFSISEEDINVTMCKQIKSTKDLPEKWRKCYPFGDDSLSMTCEQHLLYMVETDREERRLRLSKEEMDRRQFRFDFQEAE